MEGKKGGGRRREGGRQAGRQEGRKKDRKKERKKEGDRQTDRQTGRQTEKKSLLCTKLMFGFYFQSSLFLLLFLLQTHRTILVPPWGVDEEGLSVTCLWIKPSHSMGLKCLSPLYMRVDRREGAREVKEDLIVYTKAVNIIFLHGLFVYSSLESPQGMYWFVLNTMDVHVNSHFSS